MATSQQHSGNNGFVFSEYAAETKLTSDQIDTSKKLLFVATRCIPPNAINTSLRQCMSRSTHIARDNIKSLIVVTPNFYLNAGIEVGSGGITTCTGAVEYPLGVFTPLNYSGKLSGTIADNSLILSDFCAVNIPTGATFWILEWRSNPIGIVYTGPYASITGDGFVASTTTTPDLTNGGTVTQATVNGFFPLAVLAYTSNRGVLLIGDSIGAGSTDTADGPGDIGINARSIGQVVGYSNMSVASDSASIFLGNNKTNRLFLSKFASDIIIQYGTNDIGITGAVPASSVLTNLASVVSLFPSQRVYLGTIPPRTTSTDSWITIGNQSVIAATETIRIAVNTGIRGGVVGVSDVFDLASIAETSRNSGIFNIDANSTSPAITSDGVHFLAKGCNWIARAGAIAKAIFTLHN